MENRDYKIELIRTVACENKKDLELREGFFIEDYRNRGVNIVNRGIAGQTRVQYRGNNRIKIRENDNQKYVCQCGGKYTKTNKLKHTKTKKHCDYINYSKTLINNGTINITINRTNPEDLNKLDILNIVK